MIKQNQAPFGGLRASTSVAGTCQVGGARGHGHTEQPVIAAFPPSCGIVSLVSFNGNLLWVRTQNYQRLRYPHFDPYPRSPGSRVRPKPPSAWVWAGFLALSLGVQNVGAPFSEISGNGGSPKSSIFEWDFPV